MTDLFTSILNESPTEVIRPKPMPKGTYLATVGAHSTGVSSKQQTPFVRFPLTLVSALDDVDTDELEEAGGCDGKSMNLDFYIPDNAKYRLDEFHEHCGLDLSEEASRLERCEAVVNAQVLVVIDHEIDQKDPSKVYTRIRRTAKAD